MWRTLMLRTSRGSGWACGTGSSVRFTFLISLFNHGMNIYDVHNNGNWYNFGFMLGVSAVFSGAGRSGAAARRRPSRSGKRAGHE